MNKIKAIMHNKVLWKMVHEEEIDYDYIVVDEFAREQRYYEYINESSLDVVWRYPDCHWLLDCQFGIDDNHHWNTIWLADIET